jgi:hypothetical protein
MTSSSTAMAIAPIAREGPLYPLGGEARYNISKYEKNTNTTTQLPSLNNTVSSVNK